MICRFDSEAAPGADRLSRMMPDERLGEASTPGVLVLGGPTASGKTAFAIELAERYDAEIIGADSRQIYRGMPIGTAAPTAAQLARVHHHLVGWLDPHERYSAARFVTDAARIIAMLAARGKRSIVVGGTGFYLRALCGGVDLGREPESDLRARVLREAQTHPIDVLHEWLVARNRSRAATISVRDPYRIVRALEIDLAARAPATAAMMPALPTLRACAVPFVKLAVRADLALLTPRIAARTASMLQSGFIEEAERVGIDAVAADAVGYREAFAYRQGWLTRTELETILTRATRRYAKRQLTWFRAEPDLAWVDAGDAAAVDGHVAALGWTPIEPSAGWRRIADTRA